MRNELLSNNPGKRAGAPLLVYSWGISTMNQNQNILTKIYFFFVFHELFCFCNSSLALFTVTHKKQPEPKNELDAVESEIMRKNKLFDLYALCFLKSTFSMFRQVHAHTYKFTIKYVECLHA